METGPLSLAMTHMRMCKGQGGHDSTDYTECGPLCRWVENLAVDGEEKEKEKKQGEEKEEKHK